MRELIENNQRITMVTYDFRNANKGTIVEFNNTQDLFKHPKDEYTKFLLSSIRNIKV